MLSALIFWLLGLALSLGLPIAGLVVALRVRRSFADLERRHLRDAEELNVLSRRVRELERQFGGKAADQPAPSGEVPIPTPLPAFVTAEVSPAPALPPTPVPVVVEPALTKEPTIEVPVAVTEEEPVAPAPAEPAVPAEEPIVAAPPPYVPADEQPPAMPPPPSSPPAERPWAHIDWENLVGVKLFSWIAGIALVFAAIFFLRYSIEHGWLSPAIRMATGLVVGAGLLVFCELRAAQRYPVTANALDAAGIAILFSTLFASHALWDLLPQIPVFILMALVAAVAVLLSVRRDSLFIALLGLLGGFATPALLSTGEDRPIGLFGYLLLLNLGVAWVAQRKQWPLLATISVALTAVYQWGWTLRFLDAGRLPLAMAIFLVFPVLHMFVFVLSDRDHTKEGQADWIGRTATASCALPLLFAVFMAAVPAYGAQSTLLFGFLLLVSVGLLAITLARGPELLHGIGGVATLIAFAVWFNVSYHSGAWPGVLGFVAVFVLIYLTAPIVAHRLQRPFTREAKHAQLVAALLMFSFPALVALEPATAAPGLLFTTLFVLLAVIAATAPVTETGHLHFVSAAFALGAEALWSARYLTPDNLLAGLTMYAAFGLFYLGVPVAAERMGKKLEPEGSGAVLLFISLGFLFFLATGPVAPTALWGMALLLVILNAGLFFEASRGRLPALSVAGVLLSWIVIAVWWATAMVAPLLIPSLLLVTGFALVVLVGNAWTREQASARGISGPSRSAALALVGHLFLLFVASQESLAVPPWPLLGVLVVLDLAVGAAALYSRQASLHGGALALSQLVLILWIMVAEIPPWPLLGILSALLIAAFGLLWIGLARRVSATTADFAQAALSGIYLAEITVIVASGQPVPPALAWVIGVQVLLLVALLAVVSAYQWFGTAVWAVVLPTAQVALLMHSYLTPDTWLSYFIAAAALYAPFVLYPIWLGRRAGSAREPYLAGVVASGAFFILARQCMDVGGWGGIIAVLPVGQALLLLGVLARLLAIEEPGGRQSGRVALVAGAALAFVTAAIPLQLEREWITIGWALEAVALAWLYGKIPHRGLFVWSTGLAATVMVRLCMNPAVLAYHARSEVAIFNWYLYTYLIAAAAMFAAARLLRRTDDNLFDAVRVSDLLPGAGTILLFLLLNIEIADFYATGPSVTFNFSAGLAQDLTYTIGWALFAIVLLSAGITASKRIPRTAALALLTVTVLKCFLHDLWRLGGLYRVASFVGLAMSLALVAVLMQRFVLGAQKETA